MIIPYDHLISLFEPNPEPDIFFEDNVIYIDNYYKNYEEIYEVLTNMPVPRWKWIKGPSNNFKNYYDCRPVFHNDVVGPTWEGRIEWLCSLIDKYYGNQPSIYLKDPHYEFNYFKHIKDLPSKNMQFHPHVDTPFASIIYLDKVCSGGTMVYNMDAKPRLNKEGENLFFDVSQWEQSKLIEARPNRHVIFNGTQYHGGFIADHSKYVDDWRINQVIFYNVEGYDSSVHFDLEELKQRA